MKLLCILFSTFPLFHISHAAPTETSLHYTVTDQLQLHDAASQEEQLIGMPCNYTCSEHLFNVKCHEKTKTCECEQDFPVQLARKRGCAKPSSLGEQCIYSESCAFKDNFSTCAQVSHNAYCQCIAGYHEVPMQKTKKAFCSKDILQIAKDLPTLLFVISAVAVLSTLICFVLKLFVGKSHNYERSTITTRLLSTSEIAEVARSFRQSNRSRTYSRRGSRGVTVSSSRATAARAAAILLVSCHLTNQELPRKSLDSQVRSGSVVLVQGSERSSPRSFSAKQFKRECDQKVARSRQMCNQQSSSSLDPFSSPKRSLQKRPHSSSLNDLNDSGSTKRSMQKTAHFSLSEDIIAN